jgi:hypothetical protein
VTQTLQTNSQAIMGIFFDFRGEELNLTSRDAQGLAFNKGTGNWIQIHPN